VTVGSTRSDDDSTPRDRGHTGCIDFHRHLDCSPASPRSARGLVRDAFATCDAAADRPEDVLDTAVLLTSELVTNALVHAATDLTVHVDLTCERLRVEVDDGSAMAPAAGPVDMADLVSTGGRGLPLVATLALRWGWEPLADGKRVWFEV
jgi:anti-sigma regulatory factor (Ser/Thr protein kinase)